MNFDNYYLRNAEFPEQPNPSSIGMQASECLEINNKSECPQGCQLYLIFYSCIWPCTVVSDLVQLYLTMYTCIWSCTIASHLVQLYLTLYSCIWPCTIVYVTLYNCIWSCTIVFDYVQLHLTLYNCIWLLPVLLLDGQLIHTYHVFSLREPSGIHTRCFFPCSARFFYCKGRDLI